MFKVLVIDDSMGRNFEERPIFRVGDIVTADHADDEFYFISEHLYNVVDGSLLAWIKTRFAPLSEIDETELIKERQEYETAI